MTRYQLQYQYSFKESVLKNMADFLLIFAGLVIVACGGSFTWQLVTKRRLTGFFVLQSNKLHQDLNHIGKNIIRLERKRIKDYSLNKKMAALASLLIKKLKNTIPLLAVNTNYQAKTHLKSAFERAENKKIIVISSAKKANKRLLIEAMAFLGWYDFFRVLFCKKSRHALFKQFYIIEFTRNG